MWPDAVSGAVSGAVWRDGVSSLVSSSMVWDVSVYVLATSLKKFTPWCLMGSLEKGTRTAKTNMKLANKNSGSGTIPRDVALESEKPALQPGNTKTVWLCQETLLPGINYCFLITAFPLQLVLANLLYLGLH